MDISELVVFKNFHLNFFSFDPGSIQMIVMQKVIQISTPAHNGLYDITREVEAIVAESSFQTGMVNVYVQGATAGIMILFI